MQVRDNSRDFRAPWFLEQFESGREGPELDFKSAVYKLIEEIDQFEFARDIVAFANVAARTNHKCWVLFGVGTTDPVTKQPIPRVLVDVRQAYPGGNKIGSWNNPLVDVHYKQTDGVETVLNEIAELWIDPGVAGLFALEYGEIDGTFVSYIEIKPTPASKAYCLKRRGTLIGRSTALTISSANVRD